MVGFEGPARTYSAHRDRHFLIYKPTYNQARSTADLHYLHLLVRSLRVGNAYSREEYIQDCCDWWCSVYE